MHALIFVFLLVVVVFLYAGGYHAVTSLLTYFLGPPPQFRGYGMAEPATTTPMSRPQMDREELLRFLTNNQTEPHVQELRSKDSIEFFGQRYDVPDWMNDAAEKTKGMFDSATDLFGKDTSTSRKSSDGLMASLKSDESMRIWFAVYLNVLALILIYLFIVIKLALLSLSEGKEERRKRNRYSSHVQFDSPDYNLPLASIATRTTRPSAPMSVENPMIDLEMAREATEEEESIVHSLHYDAIPSTELDESIVHSPHYDAIPSTELDESIVHSPHYDVIPSTELDESF